jgi:hypothetical protein
VTVGGSPLDVAVAFDDESHSFSAPEHVAVSSLLFPHRRGDASMHVVRADRDDHVQPRPVRQHRVGERRRDVDPPT